MDEIESMQEQMTIYKETEILRKKTKNTRDQKTLTEIKNAFGWGEKLWARECINSILENWKAKRIKTEKQNRR